MEDVKLTRQTVREAMGVKAAGGIRTYAPAMIEAGADRTGTSTAHQHDERGALSSRDALVKGFAGNAG